MVLHVRHSTAINLPRWLPGDQALAAGWLAPRPDCRTCGQVFIRRSSTKDGRPDYIHAAPECDDCSQRRIDRDLRNRNQKPKVVPIPGARPGNSGRKPASKVTKRT